MKCPNCGQICRNNRDTCALCGTPLTQKRSHGWLITLIIFLLLVVAGLAAYQFWLKDLWPVREEQPAEESTGAVAGPDAPETSENASETPETEEISPDVNRADPNDGEVQEPEETPAPTYQVIEIPVATPEPIKDQLFENAAEIYAFPSYSLALCKDGSVKVAGRSASSEFDFTLFDWSGIKQLLPTDYFIVGLTESGHIRLTGEVSGYEEAARWTDVAKVYYDDGTLLGLTTDGRVLVAEPEPRTRASDYENLDDIVAIIPASYDTLAVGADGRITYLKRSGALYDAEEHPGLRDVAVGPDFALYLMDDGKVISTYSLHHAIDPAANPYEDWDNMQQLVIMNHIVAGLTRDGQVLCATHVLQETAFDTSSWTGVVRLIPAPNGDVLYALTEDGRVLAAPASAAEALSAWENVQDLQVTAHYVAALTGDGRVLIWSGDGATVELDTGDWTDVAVISLAEAERNEHLLVNLLALRTDGVVLAAGDNSFGQDGPAN